MKLQATEVRINGARLGVVMVPTDLISPAGDRIISLAQPFFPTIGIMLVAIGDNGFQSYAHFQHKTFVALLQLEELSLYEIDLDQPPVRDEEPPF